LISLGLIVIFALLDEYHQSFVTTRQASVYDSLIDIAGGLTALIIVSATTRIQSKIETL
jgi:VanZ family protein